MAEQGRVNGTEMEWSITIKRDSARTVSLSPNGSILGDEVNTVIQEIGSSNTHLPYYSRNKIFTANGAALWYQDIGEHLESTTAEDVSFLGTIANETVAAKMLFDALNRLKESARSPIEDFAIHKRVCDDQGNTWGYHENYCADASRVTISAEGLSLLGLHLATRNIYAGSGKWLSDGTFLLSQKSSTIRHDFNVGTTNGSKPVVNLRNEPLADEQRFVRVHVVSGDPHMSDKAGFEQLATTSSVISLIEEGVRPETLGLGFEQGQLVKMSGIVNKDITMQKPVTLAGGKTILPKDIQWTLLNEVKRHAERREFSSEEQLAIQEWEGALQDLEVDPLSLANRGVEWAIQYKIGQRCLEKQDIKDNTALLNKTRTWTRIDPEKNTQVRKTLFPEWDIEALVAERMVKAPQTTRAAIRSEAINQYAGYPGCWSAWENITIDGRMLSMADPYLSSPYQNTH